MIRTHVSRTLAPAVFAAALALAGLAPLAAATPVALPAYTKTKLANGLTVIVMPTRRLPLVDLRLVARAGSVNDPGGKDGLAALTASLLTQGAGTRTAKQIAEDVEFVGGSLDAGAGTEQLVVTCEMLKKDFALGLGLFHDVIVKPTFAPPEFARKQAETLGDIASSKDDPSTVASRSMLRYLWGDSPLGHPTVGLETTVKALTREDVAAFHRRFVAPDNAILAVVGDVDGRAVIGLLERAFADWKPSGERADPTYAAPPQVHGRTVRIISKPEVTQTQIQMGCMGVPRNHPDWFPIQVANIILGEGFTSRLVNELRVNQGLTYNIRSRFDTYRNAGAFRITTFTKNETLRKTIDATLVELKKLVDQGPTDAELDKSHKYLVGQFPLGLQAPDDLAGALADVEFFGVDPRFIEAYNDRVEAVTMADVKRVLRQHFCVDDLKLLVVSNPATARAALSGLGPIEVKPVE